MTITEILEHEESFKYQILDRMRTDCEYYLGYGGRCANHLWAGNEVEQIKYMKAIWKSFEENKKPQWLKYWQILEYEKKMVKQDKKDGTWLVGYITVDKILVCSYTSNNINESKAKMKEVIKYWEHLGNDAKISIDYTRYAKDKEKNILDNAYIVANYYETNGCKDIRDKNCLSHNHYILNDITYVVVREDSYYNNRFIRGMSMQLL